MIQNNTNIEIRMKTNESLENMITFQTLSGKIYPNSKVIQICLKKNLKSKFFNLAIDKLYRF